jgi:hypothetical protein
MCSKLQNNLILMAFFRHWVRVLPENNYPFVIALYPHPGPSPSGRGVLNPAPLLPREKGLGDEGKGWTFYSLDYSKDIDLAYGSQSPQG